MMMPPDNKPIAVNKFYYYYYYYNHHHYKIEDNVKTTLAKVRDNEETMCWFGYGSAGEVKTQ